MGERNHDNMTTVTPQLAATKPPRRWYQFGLRTLLVFVTIVAIFCSIGVCIHWVVAAELSALVVFVALLAKITARAIAATAHIMVIVAQTIGVGVNVAHMILALLCGLIGFTHGTDTSAEFNNRLALVGFSCAAVAMVNCLALLASRRAFLQVLLPIAVAGNCITLALAILAIACPEIEVVGGVGPCVIYYSLTFISINAIAVRLTSFHPKTQGNSTEIGMCE